MKILLTTVPEETIGYTQDMKDQDPGLEEFHPSLLYVCRRRGRGREYDKEPVPNWKMFRQQINIRERKVFITNQTSDLDAERNIPDEDYLFDLGSDNVIHIGEEPNKLNMIILKNVTDKRSKDPNDVTLGKMIRSRVRNSDVHSQLEKYFSGESVNNKTRMRLKVEVFCSESGDLLSRVWSGPIINTDSKLNGALEFYDVIPNKSCAEANEKIVMISQFALDKHVKPRLQLWREDDVRVPAEEEDELLVQPSEFKTVRDTIVFQAPPQPHLEEISSLGYRFRLVGVRGSDDYESKPHDFFYFEHNLITYQECQPLPDDPSLVNIVQKCALCQFDPGNSKPKSLLPTLESAKPNRKRKTLHRDAVGKTRRVSSNSSQSSMFSPDSGLECPDSPSDLTNLFTAETIEELEDLHSGQDTVSVDFDVDKEGRELFNGLFQTDGASRRSARPVAQGWIASNEGEERREGHEGLRRYVFYIFVVIVIGMILQEMDLAWFNTPVIFGCFLFLLLLSFMYMYNNVSNLD